MSSFDPQWWRKIFDELYLSTDARSIGDSAVTLVEADMIEHLLKLEPGDRVLDLCGGQGRHAVELAKRGYANIIVADYSMPLLRCGQETSGKSACIVSFLRCDARFLAFKHSTFDHVMIMGNSFGYFRDDTDNCLILSEVARVLKPRGRILIDLVNKNYIVSRFREQSWHEADDDLVVCRHRRLEDDGIVVREMVLSKSRGLLRDVTYFSRLFEKEELDDILRCAGFRNVSFIDEFKPHGTEGDYGMLTNRTIVSAAVA